MKQLTFDEVFSQGFKEVIVQSYGYEEGRVCPIYQPFKHKKNIVFRIDPLGYLYHPTFWLKEDESDLDYILKDDGKVYVNDPNIGADIDY